MVAGPGDEIAAAQGQGRGGLRASHADREQVIEVLKAAFVQGRLAKDEFDLRVDQALASRTYAELAAVTADIPAAPTAALPLREPARAPAKPQMNTGVRTGVRVIIIAATVLAILVLVHPDNGLAFITDLGAASTVVVASALTMVLMVESRRQKRSGGHLPPRPGRDGIGIEDGPTGSTGHDPALPRARPDQTRTGMWTHSPQAGSVALFRAGCRAPRGLRPVPDGA